MFWFPIFKIANESLSMSLRLCPRLCGLVTLWPRGPLSRSTVLVCACQRWNTSYHQGTLITELQALSNGNNKLQQTGKVPLTNKRNTRAVSAIGVVVAEHLITPSTPVEPAEKETGGNRRSGSLGPEPRLSLKLQSLLTSRRNADMKWTWNTSLTCKPLHNLIGYVP